MQRGQQIRAHIALQLQTRTAFDAVGFDFGRGSHAQPPRNKKAALVD